MKLLFPRNGSNVLTTLPQTEAEAAVVVQVNLAHIAFANLLVTASLRLLYRARYLLLLAAGETHPFMSTIDVSVGYRRIEVARVAHER